MRSNKFSIGYFADGIWAHETLRLLVADAALEIRFVCVRNDSKDKVLVEMAEANAIPVLRHPNINSPEFLVMMKAADCDLFVSMSFNQIFRREILSIPRRQTINCHAGKLPFYRGRNILNWVLINDEKEFGITVHYIDEGIDTGDIIAQECHAITDEDDYGSLLARAHMECAAILYRAISDLRRGTVSTKRQSDIHPVGFYCGMRKEGDEKINWDRPSRDVFNFIRAISSPGPEARSSLNGQEMRIARARLIKLAPNYRGIAGQVVGKSPHRFIVKTADSTIEVTEFTFSGKIRIGDRLT